MRRRFLGSMIPAALLAVACAAPAPPAADLAAEEKAIRDVSMRWLEFEKARDVDGQVALMSDDVVVYRANREPMNGPAAFKEYMAKDYADNPKAVVTWSTTSVRVSNSAELGVESGEFSVKGAGPKGDIDDRGRFLTVYVKSNGQWKVFRDMSMSTVPDTAKAKTGG